MSDAAAEPAPAGPGEAVFAMLDEFLAGADAAALVRARAASVDTTFADSGTIGFEAPGLAARGSQLVASTRDGSVSPDRLTLVPPPSVRLTLADVTRRLGEARQVPALPGQGWRYQVQAGAGRSTLVVLSSDPKLPTSQVASLTALRER